MRKKHFSRNSMVVAFLTIALFLASCGGSSDGPGNLPTGPDGSGNLPTGPDGISFVIGSETYTFSVYTGGYDADLDQTCVVGLTEADWFGNYIHFYFPGDTTGEFDVDSSSPEIATYIGIGIDGENYYTWRADCECDFTINVTSYGSVGQRIVGTFEGTLVKEGGTEINVEEGFFSVIRGGYPDA